MVPLCETWDGMGWNGAVLANISTTVGSSEEDVFILVDSCHWKNDGMGSTSLNPVVVYLKRDRREIMYLD